MGQITGHTKCVGLLRECGEGGGPTATGVAGVPHKQSRVTLGVHHVIENGESSC